MFLRFDMVVAHMRPSQALWLVLLFYKSAWARIWTPSLYIYAIVFLSFIAFMLFLLSCYYFVHLYYNCLPLAIVPCLRVFIYLLLFFAFALLLCWLGIYSFTFVVLLFLLFFVFALPLLGFASLFLKLCSCFLPLHFLGLSKPTNAHKLCPCHVGVHLDASRWMDTFGCQPFLLVTENIRSY